MPKNSSVEAVEKNNLTEYWRNRENRQGVVGMPSFKHDDYDQDAMVVINYHWHQYRLVHNMEWLANLGRLSA